MSIDNVRECYSWMLPALFFLLLPFGAWIYVPLVLMAIIGVLQFPRNEPYGELYKKHGKYRAVLITFSLIWVPMLVSLIDAANLIHSLKTTLSLAPYLFVGVFLVSRLRGSASRYKLRIALLVITSLWCADAVLQWLTGSNILGHPAPGPRHLSGLFYPKFTLGLVLAVLFPVTLETLREITGKRYGILPVIILAPLHPAVIILSGSRTAFIMLVFGCIGWFIYLTLVQRRFHWRKAGIIAAIAVFLAGLLIMQQPTRLDSLTGIWGADLKTLDKISGGRLPLWEAAAGMARDHWINGIGPRGFRYIYHQYQPEAGKYYWEYPRATTHPHFALLEIFAETGVIGLAGILALLYVLFRSLRRLADTEKLEAIPWFLGVALAIVPNIAKAFYSSFWISIIMCMLFIGLASMYREKQTVAS